MPQQISTDDDIYRHRAVWLGPKGWTFPWTARYAAYGVFVGLFAAAWVVMAVLGIAGTIPIWPLSLAILGTYAVMQAVDHDVTLRSLVRIGRHEWRVWRRRRHRDRPDPTRYVNTRPKVTS